jgi:hypothetical protein
VWTGVEYQVAAHLIYEGFVDEGLALVETVRRRHDGFRRNPWNEVECGNHYVRSMASWAVLLAASGFVLDRVNGTITLAPAFDKEHFRSFFAAGSGWGTFEQTSDEDAMRVELRVEGGHLEVRRLRLDVPDGLALAELSVSGQRVDGAPPAKRGADGLSDVVLGASTVGADETIVCRFERERPR